ncbi:hypothetical protein [Paraliomyxa miuraensis]|uniref:hypothetical protein n=1 Tax=Paraliomyxa miuraensis TaxID=376150 RepID=UPI00225BCAD2|nr:hypothetical protein [Paraliomyxa miuraensis]MCX4242016.1 hypothetical protein [Paraliomyxa miuraensis]
MHRARLGLLTMALGLAACQPNAHGFGSSGDDEPEASGGASSDPTSTGEPTSSDGTGADATGTATTSDADGDGSDPPPGFVCENLLVNPSVETGNFDGWQVLQQSDAQVRQNEAHDGTWAVHTSFGPFTREQEIDLVALGLDPAFLDTSPEIVVEDWFREVYDSDPYWVRVELQNESHAPIDLWTVEGWTPGDEGYDDDEYVAEQHTFSGYPAGLRYIRFRDGGQDGEYWAGHYGVIIDAPRLELCHPR